MNTPRRAAVVCGGLGDYDRERVERMAALADGDAGIVHADERSILALDRDPIGWEGSGGRGLGWIEADLWRGGRIDKWRQASRAGLCGLVLEGRRRFVHSAVNGLAPIYWLEDGGATYFASRIDPLVRTSRRPLSIDWDAWAAIIALRYPLAERTPFAEVRRLGQFATLRRRLRRGRAQSHRWPWAETEPHTDLAGAADACAAALSEGMASLPPGVVCPLSGGRDSRLLFSLLAAEGKVAAAVTASDDEGEEIEERLAASVAAHYGVPHERLLGSPERYPEDWEERARRVEYQFVDHAWLVPAARRVEASPAPVPDGFGIDIFLQSERHFNPREALDNRDPRAASIALFDALRRYGQAQNALAPQFHEPLVARVRDEFLAAVRPFEGHPSQNVLATYATRSRRGVGCYPTGLFGAGALVVAPGASDSVASAALSAPLLEKDDGNLYRAIFERLAPEAGRLPSTTDTARTGPRLPRRWSSPAAVQMHRRSLADGPLAPHLAPAMRAWLEAPTEDLAGDLRLGMEAISLLHAWWRRYRDILRPVDPADLLG